MNSLSFIYSKGDFQLMLTLEAFSLYVMFCILAPLLGAFTLLFLFIFEKRFDLLKKQARETELEKELQIALYNQLNQEIKPHFFFNTLNSILSLARLDRKTELIRSIETLSKFMKFKYQTNESIITIHDELTYTGYYLEIQKTRFRDRLHYEISIEQEVNHALIIPYLIQTLVENAFKHAFETYSGDAHLKISISRKEQNVHVFVWNNSPKEALAVEQEGGIGLENIGKRLKLMFPSDYTNIELMKIHDGTAVIAVFPYTTFSNKHSKSEGSK